MTLTVVLGCRACWSRHVLEVPVHLLVSTPHGTMLEAGTDEVLCWVRSHHQPYARSA